MQLSFQKAILERIKGDAVLSGSLVSARDRQHPPEDAGDATLFPYLNLDLLFSGFDTDTSSGHEVTATFHVWSRSGSKAQTMAVQENLYRLFHGLGPEALQAEGSRLLEMWHEDSDIDQDPDGLTLHGVSNFRALIDGPVK